MENNKISVRRYGRLMAVLSLKQKFIQGTIPSVETLYDLISDYTELPNLPDKIRNQIQEFCMSILEGIDISAELLIKVINQHSKNRSWKNFVPLDQALLLVGVYDLGHNSSIPKICIKEILIISDMLHNENAVPYLSGILKTIAYGDQFPKKRPKIRLKVNKEDV